MFFADLLYKYRTEAKGGKISQEALGKVIGTTRQYVDAVEKRKPGGVAPNLDICLKMVETFNLSEEEKQDFLWIAFRERIQRNLDFYLYFHPAEQKSPIPTTTKQKSQFSKKNNVIFSCLYSIKWQTLNHKPLFKGLPKILLDHIIIQAGSDLGCPILEHEIHQDTLFIIIKADPFISLHKLVQDLQDLTSRRLKNQSTNLNLISKSIWDNAYIISTVGTVGEIATSQVKKTNETYTALR